MLFTVHQQEMFSVSTQFHAPILYQVKWVAISYSTRPELFKDIIHANYIYLIQPCISMFYFLSKEGDFLPSGQENECTGTNRVCVIILIFLLLFSSCITSFLGFFFLVFFSLGNFFYLHIKFSSSLVCSKICFLFVLCFTSLFLQYGHLLSAAVFSHLIVSLQHSHWLGSDAFFGLEVMLKTKQENN